MKCATCGYDDHGTGDSAHSCKWEPVAATLPAAPAPTEQAPILTADEIAKVRAAKRLMVDAMIASGMSYGSCGVVSHHLENLITALVGDAAL